MATNKRNLQDPWEILEVPPLIDLSAKNKPNTNEDQGLQISSKLKKDQKEKLCGYLNKLGAGLIKGWRKRWFTYDHRRCLLYYYRRPQDNEALGNIDIANATFTYKPEDRAFFQISTDQRTYYLEAPDRNAMMFWLQELQTRRREFCKTNDVKNRPTSGLLADHVDSAGDESEDECDGLNKPIDKPHNVGEDTAHDPNLMESWNFSFTNLNKEFKNWRKSTFFAPVGETMEDENSLQIPESDRKSPRPTRKEGDATTKTNQDNGNKRKIDFGFSRMVANLQSANTPTISYPTSLSNTNCLECIEIHGMVKTLQEAISVAEKEITTRDEVIESISEQLRFASSTSSSTKSPDQEDSEHKEQYISQLTRMVKNLKDELDNLKIRFRENERSLEEQREKEKVFKEMIQAKDNSIIDLTNQVFSLEQNQKSDKAEDVLIALEENPTEMNDGSPTVQLDYNQLKEACTAYQAQNNFLNSEILELHKLRKMDSEKLLMATENLEIKEAEILKLKSRYLWLLKDCAGPRRETDVDAGVVEKLIDDAINESENADPSNDKKSPSDVRFSDKYGFYDQFDSTDTEALETLAGRFDALIGDKEQGSMEISIGVKWENFLVAQGRTPLIKTEELKALVRIGVPHEFRARVWGDLVNARISYERSIAGPGYYAKLLKEKSGVYSPSSKQIELDLLRTLPNNKFYDKLESEGISKLRRILQAYSWHNPAVGYCQGLNRLAAIALLYLDEETAFWTLVAITEHLMPIDYYSRTLLGAQIDQKVFRDLLDEKCPKLSVHLSALQFDISLISFNWFLTVFVDLFPIELTLRVWDTFLFEGSKVLFRYALAVFKLFEEDFLRLKDPGLMFSFFRTLPKTKFNIQKLCFIAFNTMNPFSRKNVESKRKIYRPLLQAQLDEFESMRNEYREKREDIQSQDDILVSDDEN